MQHAPAQDAPQNIEMSLREHLLAQAGGGGPNPSPYPPPSASQPGADNPYQGSDSTSPHGQLDPNVAGDQLPYGMSGDSGGDEGMSPDARKGKRELSTSKRAAQNRAAQRAFRQRKEGYIKKLEEQVKEFQAMESNYRALQNENYQLREYILNLQSRLLENQSDFPPAPSHINLASTASTSASHHNNAGPSSEVDQQLRREMQHHRPPPPAPETAPPMRHEVDVNMDAAPSRSRDLDGRPQHESPYGLGAEYPSKRSRVDGASAIAGDTKPSS